MEVVLPLSRLGEMTAYMDERVSRHLHEGQSEAFEGCLLYTSTLPTKLEV